MQINFRISAPLLSGFANLPAKVNVVSVRTYACIRSPSSSSDSETAKESISKSV